MKKKIIILGSTGSIGKSTLKIINTNKKDYLIELLVAKSNYRMLYKQALMFKPKFIYLENKEKSIKLKKLLTNTKISIIKDFKSISKKINKTDLMMSAISGLDGLKYNLSLIKKTKKILFANKESIICGWNLIKHQLNKNKTVFVPVDSEHFAISQLMMNNKKNKMIDITITASGGPFLNTNKKSMANIDKKKALNHPKWKMGKKISIDSATLMNKIFEVLEAYRLFNLNRDQIKVVIHPQSIVHAIVNYSNGTSHALLHQTDMKIPIYTSIHGNNFKKNRFIKKFNINNFSKLNFYDVDKNKFPSIEILKNLTETCSLFDTVLISANDELVNLFLSDKIKFNEIIIILKKIINLKNYTKYKYLKPKNFKEIQDLNYSVRLKTRRLCI